MCRTIGRPRNGGQMRARATLLDHIGFWEPAVRYERGQEGFGCGSRCTYHLATKCPLRGNSRNATAPFARPLSKTPRPPRTSVLMGAPVSVQDDRSSARTEARSRRGQPFSTTLDSGSQLFGKSEEGKVLGAGAAASLAPEFVIAASTIWRRNVHCVATLGMCPHQSPDL